MNIQPTPRIAQVLGASGETGEIVLCRHEPIRSVEQDAEQWPIQDGTRDTEAPQVDKECGNG